jgi:hypothetical protein
MPDRFQYAIIDTFGKCWVITDDGTEKVQGLPWLMRQGWTPVRETPYHIPAGESYVLILLERE